MHNQIIFVEFRRCVLTKKCKMLYNLRKHTIFLCCTTRTPNTVYFRFSERVLLETLTVHKPRCSCLWSLRDSMSPLTIISQPIKEFQYYWLPYWQKLDSKWQHKSNVCNKTNLNWEDSFTCACLFLPTVNPGKTAASDTSSSLCLPVYLGSEEATGDLQVNSITWNTSAHCTYGTIFWQHLSQ